LYDDQQRTAAPHHRLSPGRSRRLGGGPRVRSHATRAARPAVAEPPVGHHRRGTRRTPRHDARVLVVRGRDDMSTPTVRYEELTAQPAPAASARYSYGRDPLQFGELRLPASATGTRPVIVFIHGGCWQSEYDLSHAASGTAALANAGFVVWVPEYRRLGNAGG